MRVHPRVNAVSDLCVISSDGQSHLCNLENLSAGGLLLSGPPELVADNPCGSRITVAVPLAGHEPVLLEGRVARHQPHDDQGIVLAVELEPISSRRP